METQVPLTEATLDIPIFTHVYEALWLNLNITLFRNLPCSLWNEENRTEPWHLAIKPRGHARIQNTRPIAKRRWLRTVKPRWPVSYWFEYLDLVFFYKCRNGLFNLDILKYVTPYSKSRVTRNPFISIDYKPNLTKTSTFRDSYFNRIIPLWNSLPFNTKESTTLSSFKTKVRSHYKSLLHSAFDSDRIRTFKTICS